MAKTKVMTLERMEEYNTLLGQQNATNYSKMLGFAKQYTNEEIAKVKDGTTVAAEATHAASSDSATTASDSSKLGGQVPSYYAKASDVPTGALANKSSVSESDLDSALVEKVNAAAEGNHSHSNKTVLDGITSTKVSNWDSAEANAKSYTDSKTTGMATTSVVDSKISTHNSSETAHSDIRGLITSLTTKVNNFLDVDDTTTDQLSEVLTLISNNKGTLESLTSGKVNVSDIVDNLTTSSTTKVLSAKQGVALKALIDALQESLDDHGHEIADVTGLQAALDGKAAASHGTHVTFDSTNKPKMDGTAAYGTSTKVARADHVHPTDTSRAAQADLTSHTGDTTKHITATERTNWGAAYTHSQAAHAPSNAEKNQNAFSNIVVGDTTIAADTATDSITLEGSNVTITPDATNDKITIGVESGSTSKAGILKLTNSTSSTSTTTAATPNSVKSAYDLANQAKTAAETAQSTADGKANATHNHAISDITNLQTTLNNASSAISANTTSISGHTTRISDLETKVGDGFEEITSDEIQAMFKA